MIFVSCVLLFLLSSVNILYIFFYIFYILSIYVWSFVLMLIFIWKYAWLGSTITLVCIIPVTIKCFHLMILKAILVQYSVTTLYSYSVIITNTQSSIIKREVIEYMTFDVIPIQWLFCCNSNQANWKVRHYNDLSLFCCVLQWNIAGWWRVIQSELNDCSNRTAPVTLWKHHHLTLWPSGSVILSLTHTHTSTSLFKACMHVLHKHTWIQS